MCVCVCVFVCVLLVKLKKSLTIQGIGSKIYLTMIFQQTRTAWIMIRNAVIYLHFAVRSISCYTRQIWLWVYSINCPSEHQRRIHLFHRRICFQKFHDIWKEKHLFCALLEIVPLGVCPLTSNSPHYWRGERNKVNIIYYNSVRTANK